MKKLLHFTLLLLPSLAFGQAWSGLLTTSRAIDWTHAGATIPTVNTLCSTQPSASIASINAAIAADVGGASPCVINIPAVSGATGTIGVRYAGKANVVLRGSGANSSIITYSSGPGLSNCNGLNQTYVCVWNGDSSSPGNWVSTNLANWTGGLSQGSTVLTLSNTTNLKVGMEVVLYQTDPATDTGNVWPCQSQGFNGACSWQGTGSTPVSGGGAGGAASESQMITVAACNGISTYGTSCGSGTSVTSASPIYMPNWNSGQNPKAAWGNTMPISNVGLEDFEINDQTGSNGIFVELHQSTNVWINGVATIANPAAASDTNHILIWASNHDTAENCYMYGSYPASSGYGLDFAADTADSLAQNCITQHMDTGFITETGMGNVFGYDYSIDNYFGGAWQQDDEYQHSAGDYYNLREGIEGIGYNSDNIHGTHWFNTVDRSYFSGFDPTTYTGGKNQSQIAMNDAALARYDNWVANVLGTAGYFSTYQLVPSSTTTCSPGPNTPAIYEMGYSDSGAAFSPACQGSGAGFAIPNDVSATSGSPVTSTMRWNNYDTVTGAIRQCKSGSGSPCSGDETASSASTYPGLANPSTTTPVSLYLSGGTPSWWNFPGGTTAPYPAIGNDVTGGNISGVSGHAWHGPAWNCYNVVSSGVTNGNPTPISFNRASCYPGGSTPTISLTVSTGGAGTGTISGSNCASNFYSSGTTIGACTATPTGTSTFTGWTGTGNASACTGTGTCGPFNLTSTSTIVANFAAGPTQAATPVITPATGTYSGAQSTSITCSTPSSTINYTLDGSTPTTGSTLYSAPFTLFSTTTVKAVCNAAGFSQSNVATSIITITTPSCGNPSQNGPPANPTYNFSNTFTCSGSTCTSSAGTSAYPLLIGFTSPTAGCSMFMTLDGSAPTCSSTAYSPQSLTVTTTMRVIACQATFTSSAIVGGTWTIINPPPPVTTIQGAVLNSVVIH